jgi:MFS family permease
MSGVVYEFCVVRMQIPRNCNFYFGASQKFPLNSFPLHKFAQYILQLMLARFIVGLAVAVCQVVSGTYLTEIAPPSQRGRVNMIISVTLR